MTIMFFMRPWKYGSGSSPPVPPSGGDDAWGRVGGPIIPLGGWKKRQKVELPQIEIVEELAGRDSAKEASGPEPSVRIRNRRSPPNLQPLLDEFKKISERIEDLERRGQELIQEGLLRQRLELAKRILEQEEEEFCLLLLMMQ